MLWLYSDDSHDECIYSGCMDQQPSANLDWIAIWNAAEDARLVRGWTKQDLYTRAGISHTAYRDMQLGTPLKRADKIHSFITALGWSVDDLDAIGQGGEPPVVTPPEGDALELDDLRQQVAALQDLLLTLHRAVRENTQTIRAIRESAAQSQP